MKRLRRVMRVTSGSQLSIVSSQCVFTDNRELTTENTSGLALAELEASSCTLLSVLLALFGARITGDEAFALERLAELGVEHHQRAGNAELHGVSLTHHAATANGGDDVEGLADVGDA